MKGPRFATNRKVLAEAGASIERFFSGGVMELKEKLGPVNWQFMASKKFDPDDFAAFLALLPKEVEGRTIRHAVEVRHASFRAPDFVALAREHGVAVIVDADSRYPQIADVTAPFVYARIMGTEDGEPAGYPPAALDAWAERARRWAEGGAPDDLETVAAPAAGGAARRLPLCHQRRQAAQPGRGDGADRADSAAPCVSRAHASCVPVGWYGWSGSNRHSVTRTGF